MSPQPISSLAIGADFGQNRNRNRFVAMVSSLYRWIILLLVTGVLTTHMLLTGAFAPLALGILVCWAYVLLRAVLPSTWETHLYSNRMQIVSGQVAVFGVMALLTYLALAGYEAYLLWTLFLPAQLGAGFYERQSYALFVLAETSLFATGVYVLELFVQSGGVSLSPIAVAAHLFTVTLACFLTYSLARLYLIRTQGNRARDAIVQRILMRILVDSDGMRLWNEILGACCEATNAGSGELYLVQRPRNRLRRLEEHGDGYHLGMKLSRNNPHIAARAARNNSVEQENLGALVRLAAPIHGLLGRESQPVAVIVLEYQRPTRREIQSIRQRLDELLKHIGPLFTYAGIHQYLPVANPAAANGVHRLAVNDVVNDVLETVCHRLQFSFATISLVDEHMQEIRAIAGKYVQDDWIADAHHRTDSDDIQAVVLRTGKSIYIDRWDERLDIHIWRKFHHDELVRVFVPLGRLGTIEAGFKKSERQDIPPTLIQVLERYARDVTIAIHNAQLFERERRHAATLKKLNTALAALHNVRHDVLATGKNSGEEAVLQHITDVALDVLGADIVMLYPPDWQAPHKRLETILAASPIVAGTIRGHTELKPPDTAHNIITSLAQSRTPYYQPDAQDDPLLMGKQVGKQNARSGFTFTKRQGVLSFAGVPLFAGGKLLGVLCVNYRHRYQFDDYDRQVIELFAQQAGAVIASSQLVREQERRQLEDDLHDWVKSSVSGLVLSSNAALAQMERNPEMARTRLREVQYTADGILTDIDILLNRYPLNGYDGQSLHRMIDEDLHRLVAYQRGKVRLLVDPRIPTLTIQRTRTVLRILREAVINAYKYAQAEHIVVRVHHGHGCLQLLVRDNGIGFETRTSDSMRHRGIQNMRRHVEELQGTLRVQSELGHGTRIYAAIPHKEEAHGVFRTRA